MPAETGRTALVVPVPAAEPLVSGWRMQHDPSAAVGMPAHVTALFPFLHCADLSDAVLDTILELCAELSVLNVIFRRTGRFPGVLYLDPEPADGLRELTAAIGSSGRKHRRTAGPSRTSFRTSLWPAGSPKACWLRSKWKFSAGCLSRRGSKRRGCTCTTVCDGARALVCRSETADPSLGPSHAPSPIARWAWGLPRCWPDDAFRPNAPDCTGRVEQRLEARYACRMRSDRCVGGFKLVEVTEPGILASLERIDAMSDAEIRELARDEPQVIVDAAEGIIADRHRGRAPHTS
jgi:2'-5' RNA ligase superfamily